MVHNGDFQPGQEAFYHEDGNIYKVKVLKSEGDEKQEKYELKILGVIRESPIVKTATGTVFSCGKLRNVSCSGLWHLFEH